MGLTVWLQEISFFEQGEPIVDGDPGDLKVPYIPTCPFSSPAAPAPVLMHTGCLRRCEAFREKNQVLHVCGRRISIASVAIPGVKIGDGMGCSSWW